MSVERRHLGARTTRLLPEAVVLRGADTSSTLIPVMCQFLVNIFVVVALLPIFFYGQNAWQTSPGGPALAIYCAQTVCESAGCRTNHIFYTVCIFRSLARSLAITAGWLAGWLAG